MADTDDEEELCIYHYLDDYGTCLHCGVYVPTDRQKRRWDMLDRAETTDSWWGQHWKSGAIY